MGFKNARKSTTYAAEAAAEKLGADALRLGFNTVRIQHTAYSLTSMDTFALYL
jgi:ribosomal protein S11